jgi:hypothetical protein
VITDLPGASHDDLDEPAPGTSWYYLVRATNGCGAGPWGNGTAGEGRIVGCP